MRAELSVGFKFLFRGSGFIVQSAYLRYDTDIY